MAENNLLRYIGMSLEFFAAFILLLTLFCCLIEKNKTRLLKLYIFMASSCVVALLSEAISIALYEREGMDGVLLLLYILSLTGGYSLAFSYACYIANLVGTERVHTLLLIRVLYYLWIISTAMLVTGGVSGIFFTVRNGIFTPNRWFLCIFAYDILACAVGIFLIVFYRKQLNLRDMMGLGTMPLFILFSAVLQYLFYKLSVWLFLWASISVFVIYLLIQIDRNQQKLKQEKQLMDMNIAIMLSQIQPHFLYNALSSIRRMIKKDPAVAQTAIENFSQYLRQNLESMSRVEPIPFSTELQHVEEYLYLEKLRFGDRLRVEYDIACGDFSLPVLTLQPIVENAVKHGILRKEEGGTVRISTRLEDGWIHLTVQDDGVGWLSSEESGDRLHIGLANVQSRIHDQCGGAVRIYSQVGIGTTVTILLPLL